MKAAVLREVGKPLQIEDVQINKPGPREVLIRTASLQKGVQLMDKGQGGRRGVRGQTQTMSNYTKSCVTAAMPCDVPPKDGMVSAADVGE